MPRFLIALFAVCAVTACAGPAAEPADQPGYRIVLRMHDAAHRPSDSDLLESLSERAKARLTLDRTLADRYHRVIVQGPANPAELRAALARLRTDPRVESAEIDARRLPN